MTVRSHPVPLMAETRSLHAAGWKVSEIHQLLKRRGLERVPSIPTLYTWVNDEYRERHRASCASRHASRSAETATFRLRSMTPQYVAAFARELRKQRVPRTSIAKVLCVVDGRDWTPQRVSTLLQDEAGEVA